MLAAIDNARASIRFETYTFCDDEVGRNMLEAFIAAQRRGVKVQALIDAVGSVELSASFWAPLKSAGGEVRWFNPLHFEGFAFRDHRKLLVCDDWHAIIGGFNVAREYLGDGVTSGWSDLGLRLTGPLAPELADAFDRMFSRSEFRHRRFMRWRNSVVNQVVRAHAGQLLLSGPGRERNPFKRALRADFARAQSVQIIAAYFLPNRRLRRDLIRAAHRGAKVQLILAGKSDVAMARLASRSLYSALLKAGIEIYEYQPQILHAKLIVIDGAVYAGSANIDRRSLSINYELMLRLTDQALVAEARGLFQAKLALSRRINLAEWRKSQSWWRRLKQRWAYMILARLDPFFVRWQYGRLPE